MVIIHIVAAIIIAITIAGNTNTIQHSIRTGIHSDQKLRPYGVFDVDIDDLLM